MDRSLLTADQKLHVDRLLNELIEAQPATFESFLDSHCNDASVRAEVESLLQAAQAAGDFMRSPARASVDVVDGLQLPEESVPHDGFGVWRLTRRIGRGGMGVVYEGQRAAGDFAQRVAIKVLHGEAGLHLQRFQDERQILANLKHSGIAQLYDGGVSAGGRPYMVMELVEGESIIDYCVHTGADLAQRLGLFIQVCQAVAYAHRHLIVHRDLKPSNIFVNADGQVKLLDFGIAKLLDDERGALTQTLAVMLTPACAAPEQLTGKAVTTATDVYALGLLLFELLTGRPAWQIAGQPIALALRAVFERPAPVPSRVAAGLAAAPFPSRLLRGDLDAIVAKALRVEPGHRYATVEALRQDVERYRHGEPVEAREGARLYVLGRLLRRYRWEAALVLLVLLALAGGLGIAAWQARRADLERDIARASASREEAVRYGLTRLFRSALAEQGSTPTAKGLIDGSAQRVLREYRDQPQLAGQLVLTLADLYGALQDIEGAGALLEGFLDQAGSSADPATLADARQKLANIELLRGHVARAGELLALADTFWSSAPQRYAEERLEGLTIRARLQRTQGDLNGAIATNKTAIAQRVALSGRNHRETAILYNSLAITLTAANRLDEALEAYRQTSAIYDALGLGEGLDAQIILGNTGTLELRTGHLQQAERLLNRAIERERSLAGDSAAVAAALGYYGKVLSLTDRPAQAVPVLHEAVDVGARYAGATSPVTIQNRLFLGEALLAAGNYADAASTLKADQDQALAQYGEAHALTLRTRLALARLETAQGRSAQSATELAPVLVGLRALGPSAEANVAQALEALGEAQLAQGRVAEAVITLQEDVALRSRALDPGWELAEAQERLGEALALSGDSAARALLEQAQAGLTSALGAQHPETLRAQRAVARLNSKT